MSIAPRATFAADRLPHTYTIRTALQAQEATAVTIVGYGNSKNKWNGYAEVELCTHDTPVEATEEQVKIPDNETETETTIKFTELPFPADRKGFNVVNLWVHLEIGVPCSHGLY